MDVSDFVDAEAAVSGDDDGDEDEAVVDLAEELEGANFIDDSPPTPSDSDSEGGPIVPPPKRRNPAQRMFRDIGKAVVDTLCDASDADSGPEKEVDPTEERPRTKRRRGPLLAHNGRLEGSQGDSLLEEAAEANPPTPTRRRRLRRLRPVTNREGPVNDVLNDRCELSPQFIQSRFHGDEIAAARILADYQPLRRELQKDIHADISKHDRPWKRTALSKLITREVGDFSKSNRVPWVVHNFIPEGETALQFPPHLYRRWDPEMAKKIFNMPWVATAARTTMLRKFHLVQYMNHFFCHIIGDRKSVYIHRQVRPVEIAGGAPITLDVKDSKEDFRSIFAHHTVFFDGEEGGTSKKTMGDIWLSHPDQLTFSSRVFEPNSFYKKLSAAPDYDEGMDDYLNEFMGWQISPEEASRYHYQLYAQRRQIPRSPYVDLRPACGWFHLEFIDRQNASEFPDHKLGRLITVYTGLPGRPTARGPPWMRNKHWETGHYPLQVRLGEYNFGHYFLDVPPDCSTADLANWDNREEGCLSMWFNRVHNPALDCGVSVAPYLHFIYRAICAKDMQLYEYVMSWMAKWRRMGGPYNHTTLCLRSSPGSGKNMFVYALASMLHRVNFAEISSVDEALGNFTLPFSKLMLLFMDEMRCNSEAMAGKLKSLITSNQVRERRMRVDASYVKKHFSCIMSSNLDKYLHADPKERRWVFLQMAEQVCGCSNYLTALVNVMWGDGLFKKYDRYEPYNQTKAGPGIKLLAHKLDHWDYADFGEGWPVPQNPTLAWHQIESLDSVGRWWFEKLKYGHHVLPEALDDTANPKLMGERVTKAMASIMAHNFWRRYGDVEAPDPRTGSRRPLFGDEWLAEHNNGAPISTDRSQVPVFWVTIIMKCGMMNPEGNHCWLLDPRSDPNPMEEARKQVYLSLYRKKCRWVQMIWADQFYLFYRQECAAGQAVSKAAFFKALEQYSPSFADGVVVQNRAHRRDVTRVFLERNQTAVYSTYDASRNEFVRQGAEARIRRDYRALDSLKRHRKAFARYMSWKPELVKDLWKSSNPANRRSGNDPWRWFGDH